MKNLIDLNTARQKAEAAMNETAAKINKATIKRDTLAAEIANLDSAVDAAETAHAAALAAIDMGESADTNATAAALDKARKATCKKAEMAQNSRVAAAVVDGLTIRYTDAHSLWTGLSEQVRTEQVAFLEGKAREEIANTKEDLANLANRIALAQALRRVLESLGGNWTLGGIELNQHSGIFNPNHNAVDLMANAIRNEINIKERA